MIKRILLALVVLLLLAVAVTYISGDRYRIPVQVALEKGLHRKVELGNVGFRLLPTPAQTQPAGPNWQPTNRGALGSHSDGWPQLLWRLLCGH